MSGSRFPWFPVLVLAATAAWAAGGSGAAPSRDAGWGAPVVLAQVTPPAGAEEGQDEGVDGVDPSDTLGVEEGEPLNPDTTQALPPPPSMPPALPPPSDTLLGAPLDTLHAPPPAATVPDSTVRTPAFVPSAVDSATRARRAAAAADSGDTLMSARPKQTPSAATPAPEAKKPRSGIFGIHPIAILLGLAALHYFVTKSAGG